ncbi:MAG: Co2+/Mg2+ efflux protein ApaG [Chitinophagales bacterium]
MAFLFSNYMVSEITAGIEVIVETTYQEQHSVPEAHEFVFSYKIHIQNHNEFTVQLLRRRWEIVNAVGELEVIEGEGVVGRQPVLYANESHEYISGCRLLTAQGRMRGKYYFQNKITGDHFEVNIPEFRLEAPFSLN